MLSLVLRALIAAPPVGATFAHVANQMLNIALADGKPVQYRNFIRNRFTLREVIVSPVPLAEDHDTKHEYAAAVADANGATQDRRTCCGTMNQPEYQGDAEALDSEYRELKKTAGTRRERHAA